MIPPPLPVPLVLASTSRYRRAQLLRLGVAFECIAPDYPEDPVPGIAPADLLLHHAVQKTHAAARQLQGRPAWILGGDQGALIDDGDGLELIGKPHTSEAAVAQLLRLAGRTHLLRTGVALRLPSGAVLTRVVDAHMTMRPLTRAHAESYVARDQPLDCAGSYRIESLGPWLFEQVECSDPTAIEGLPLLAVTALVGQALQQDSLPLQR